MSCGIRRRELYHKKADTAGQSWKACRPRQSPAKPGIRGKPLTGPKGKAACFHPKGLPLCPPRGRLRAGRWQPEGLTEEVSRADGCTRRPDTNMRSRMTGGARLRKRRLHRPFRFARGQGRAERPPPLPKGAYPKIHVQEQGHVQEQVQVHGQVQVQPGLLRLPGKRSICCVCFRRVTGNRGGADVRPCHTARSRSRSLRLALSHRSLPLTVPAFGPIPPLAPAHGPPFPINGKGLDTCTVLLSGPSQFTGKGGPSDRSQMVG